jgi:hypothetical protein
MTIGMEFIQIAIPIRFHDKTANSQRLASLKWIEFTLLDYMAQKMIYKAENMC